MPAALTACAALTARQDVVLRRRRLQRRRILYAGERKDCKLPALSLAALLAAHPLSSALQAENLAIPKRRRHGSDPDWPGKGLLSLPTAEGVLYVSPADARRDEISELAF